MKALFAVVVWAFVGMCWVAYLSTPIPWVIIPVVYVWCKLRE